MLEFKLFDGDAGDPKVSRNKNSYLLSYPCSNSDNCIPYVASLPKGAYLFELWGAGHTKFNNGAYVSGKIRLRSKEKLFFFVGGNSVFFNSCNTSLNKGYRGNGASDIRLSYDGT